MSKGAAESGQVSGLSAFETEFVRGTVPRFVSVLSAPQTSFFVVGAVARKMSLFPAGVTDFLFLAIRFDVARLATIKAKHRLGFLLLRKAKVFDFVIRCGHVIAPNSA